jgi:hypothetical protein
MRLFEASSSNLVVIHSDFLMQLDCFLKSHLPIRFI